MPSHNIKGPKDKLLDTEAHNSVSAVVRANANNWLINTKALINQEKAKSNQYKIQSSNYKDGGKPKSDKLLNIEAKNAEKDRIKLMDEAHYSLSGKAARKRQGLNFLQPLDMTTVGGNTRLGKGGLDEHGGYLDKDFMSYNYDQNWTGKNINVNLKSKKELETDKLFGQIPGWEDSYVPTSRTVKTNDGTDLKSKERITNMLDFGEDGYYVQLPNEGGQAFHLKDGYKPPKVLIKDESDLEFYNLTASDVWFGKTALVIDQEVKMDELVDQRSWYQKAGDAIDTHVVEPVAGFLSEAGRDLYETTIIKDIHKHYTPLVGELKSDIADIGDTAGTYLTSAATLAPFVPFRTPGFIDDAKDAKKLRLAEEAELEQRIVAAHKQYGESRIESDRLTALKSREEAEKKTKMFYDSGSTIGEQRETYLKNVELSKHLDSIHTDEGEFQARKAQLAKEAEAKRLTGILDRQSEELHGGEYEARNYQKRKLELERQEAERHGGEAEAQQVHKLSKIKDKLDEEKNTKDVGLEGYVNDGTVSKADQAIFDKAKDERLRHHLGILRDESVMKGLGSEETTAIVSDHMDRNYAPRKEPHRLMATDPYAFSTHAYPKDVVEDFTNGHYMLFYVNVQNHTKYTYDGYDDKHRSVTVGGMVETEKAHEDVVAGKTIKYKTWHMEKGGNAADIAYEKRLVSKGIKGNLLKYNQIQLKKSRKGPSTGLNSYYPTTTRITDSVALYLPPNVQDNTSAGYNDFETGMAGFLAMGGVNILQQLRDHDFQGAAQILMTSGAEIAKEALKKFALGGFGALTGSEGVRQTFDKAFGQSLNPYLEVTFGSMGLRTFNYTFHFAPKSPEESLEVKDIIQLFRFHMAPELKGTNHRYLTLPSTFDIHYMFQSGMGDRTLAKENSFYSKIATCVLKGVDVNYTPGGVRSFDDGAPTQIDMTLNFQETEMLTKQKINDGF